MFKRLFAGLGKAEPVPDLIALQAAVVKSIAADVPNLQDGEWEDREWVYLAVDHEVLVAAGRQSSTQAQVIANKPGGELEELGFRLSMESKAHLLALRDAMADVDGKTWTVAHDPQVWREVADNLLFNAGVRILFHTILTGVIMDGDRHRGVVIESNAGSVAIHAKRTIDASGDAAAVARAGWDYFFGDDGRIQNPTMFFRLGNVDTDAFWSDYGDDTICPSRVTEQIVEERNRGYDLPREKIWIFSTPREGELLVNATRLADSDGRMLNVIDPEDFTIAELLGRKQVRSYADFLRRNLDGLERSFVVDTGVEAGIRQTRSIVAATTLTNEHVVECVKPDDGVVRSPWPIELHDGARPKLHWLLDDYYEVPYLTLVPQQGENIIVAGRCLGAQHEALASARVTAQCFEYGNAAGLATVLSLAADTPYRDVDVAQLRFRLAASGSAI